MEEQNTNQTSGMENQKEASDVPGDKIYSSSASEKMNAIVGKKKKKKWLLPALLAAVALCAGGFMGFRKYRAAKAFSMDAVANDAVVTRQSLQDSISVSGTVAAKSSYDVTSLKEGTIIAADFEEGQRIEKGQVMYVIDAGDLDKQINMEENNLERAKKALEEKELAYRTFLADFSGRTVKSTVGGFVKQMDLKEGYTTSGGKVGSVYSDTTMELTVPFLKEQALTLAPGMAATITLSHDRQQLVGTVSHISAQESTLSGYRIVHNVTFNIPNPGGLTTEMYATAQVGDMVSAGEARLQAGVEMDLYVKLERSVQVERVLVKEGDAVGNGTPIFTITQDSYDTIVREYEAGIREAQGAFQSAQNTLEKSSSDRGNYTITAPISGEVIKKNKKVGEKIVHDSKSDNVMAIIYDLSELLIQVNVDERQLQKVEAGQRVEATTDTFLGEVFTGKVTSTSIQPTTKDNVTTYPVVITLDQSAHGKLIPGMTLTCKVIRGNVENALTIPVDCLKRGETDRVYRKKEGAQADGDVPAGYEAVPVTVGMITNDLVEIKSGLEEGDLVYSDAAYGSMDMGMEGSDMEEMGGMVIVDE